MAAAPDFGAKWDIPRAGDFGFVVRKAHLEDGTRVMVLQLDTVLGRLGLPFTEDGAKELIRQLEQAVTGLTLPPSR